MNTKIKIKAGQTVRIATHAGALMLRAGAETYRVEDMIMRMCESKAVAGTSVFVIPSGILISYTGEDGETQTLLERTQIQSLNLEMISAVNQFARDFTSAEITYEQAKQGIDKVRSSPRFPWHIESLAISLGGSFFVLMLGGTVTEMICAYIVSYIMYSTVLRMKMNAFLTNFWGGVEIAILAKLLVWALAFFNISANPSSIIVGPLMLLVPGMALTVGIRDLISGEIVAGSGRIMEAMFIFIAIAFGVGVGIHII